MRPRALFALIRGVLLLFSRGIPEWRQQRQIFVKAVGADGHDGVCGIVENKHQCGGYSTVGLGKIIADELA